MIKERFLILQFHGEKTLELRDLADTIAILMVVEKEIDRMLTLLRNKIRERGFTQLEVQEALSWGRSYISQLLTKQKSLRVEQILMILDVIGVEPSEFFGELYRLPGADPGVRNFDDYLDRSRTASPDGGPPSGTVDEVRRGHDEIRTMLRAVVRLLVRKNVLNVDELNETVRGRNNGLLEESS